MSNRPSPERCCDCSCSSAEVRRAGGCPMYLPQSSSLGRIHVPRHRAPIGWRAVAGAIVVLVASIGFVAIVLLDLRQQGWELLP